MKHEEYPLRVLPAKKVRCLSLGVPVLNEVFPGFELGDLAILRGSAASFMSFVFSVRGQLPPQSGGLGSSVVFVDGGNSFNPYLVAEIARNYGLESRSVLRKIYVSRAFTAYQLSSLILEKLEPLLRRERCKLLVVSNITSLFSDKDVPKTEAKDLFMKVCSKLSEIAVKKKALVLASYRSVRRSKRNVFLEAVLFGKSSFWVEFRKKGEILTFVLEDPNSTKLAVDFTLDLPTTNYAPLTDFTEV
jgi:hypothetical protein